MTNPQLDAAVTASAETVAVVQAYRQATAALRQQLAAYLAALWRSLGSWREHDMADFTAQAVPLVDGAIAHMQAVTAGYLASVTGSPIAAVRPMTASSVRGGVDPGLVYGRPFHLLWRQLHDGASLADAVQSGAARVEQLAATDMQLAKTQTSQRVLSSSRHVVGYQRVLEGPHSCALCVIASTARYHKAELLPMHPACDCAVLPLLGEDDPGRTINFDLLSAAHQAVSDQFGADSAAARRIRGAFTDSGRPLLYRDVLITHEHGELGPVLGVRGSGFTGPGDIAA